MSELPVTGNRRGYAVIITNENPVDSSTFHNRKGADKDEQNLERAFYTKLKFESLNQGTSKDLRRSELFHDIPSVNPNTCACLSCKIQATDHTQSECFLLIVSTHGGEVNKKPYIRFSDQQKADVCELVDMLRDEKCSTLRGKPRILIIQACRSNKCQPEDERDDPGVTVNVTRDETLEGAMANMEVNKANDDDDADKFGKSETNSNIAINDTIISLKQDLGINERASEQSEGTDRHSEENLTDMQNSITSSDGPDVAEDIQSGEESDPDVEDTDNVYSDGKDIPEQFLIVYPTVSGKRAKRNNVSGSWLIEKLCAEIDAHDFSEIPGMNFLKILTRTTGKVARMESKQLDEKKCGLKNSVCIMHRLTKPLVFSAIKARAGTPLDTPNL